MKHHQPLQYFSSSCLKPSYLQNLDIMLPIHMPPFTYTHSFNYCTSVNTRSLDIHVFIWLSMILPLHHVTIVSYCNTCSANFLTFTAILTSEQDTITTSYKKWKYNIYLAHFHFCLISHSFLFGLYNHAHRTQVRQEQ